MHYFQGSREHRRSGGLSFSEMLITFEPRHIFLPNFAYLNTCIYLYIFKRDRLGQFIHYILRCDWQINIIASFHL